MLAEQKTCEIQSFLDQVSRMTVQDFRRAIVSGRPKVDIRTDSRRLTKLSAADSSWLDKRVRDVVEPLIGGLDWGPDSLAFRVIPLTADAAQTIVRRDRLSEVQYEAFVGGFRDAGLTIPAWGS